MCSFPFFVPFAGGALSILHEQLDLKYYGHVEWDAIEHMPCYERRAAMAWLAATKQQEAAAVESAMKGRKGGAEPGPGPIGSRSDKRLPWAPGGLQPGMGSGMISGLPPGV